MILSILFSLFAKLAHFAKQVAHNHKTDLGPNV